ncbi:carboxypeptidase regulatory-like domain-containing protein [Peristeroidobacter soli]|uniref:carboxypeptidase regulatory-like domain-containing protein n=1 Tax=Peristeroidobacter soli TaxID=2497877 RepID=UPI00101E0A97|nr:carboxypeptidase regulatory-like domain-containing protein [Peristeroidobacter soli]
MDRRRTVALILGLVLCLALLGRWVVRFDKEGSLETPAPPASEPIAKVIQPAREDSKPGSIIANEAPMGAGIFRGRVIDAATRQPIREFTVEFHPPRQPERREPPPPLSRSFHSEDGRFEYHGLPTVIGTLFTMAPGYQRFNIGAVRISENPQAKEILIPMRAGHVVSGRVIDELTKEPIASAVINFREASVGVFEGDFRSRPSARSAKDGTFVLNGVPPGAVRVGVGASGYTSKEIEILASGKTPPLEIALNKGGTIAGYLADVDGRTPVAGEISLGNLDENITVTTSTGSAGEFSFDRLKAGRYLLAGHGGNLNGQREIELAHDERLEGIVVAMSPGHSIRGVVTGLRPEELAGAYLYAFAENTRSGRGYQSTLDERGAYEVRGVAPGSVRIQVAAGARGGVTKLVQMPADSDLVANVEFKPGARLSGRVTAGGKPLAGAMLRPQSISPDGNIDVFLSPLVTSASGEYSYEDVAAGDYVFMIESYASSRVRVSGDTVFDFDVPNVHLSGHVFEEDSQVPIVGARINVRPAQRQSQSSRLSDSSDNFGQFGIRGMQPGDFVVSAYKAGYELYRAPLSYGSPISNMTIYLRPSRGVEIKVREAGSHRAIDSVLVLESINGVTGVALQLQPDRSGISYLPGGFAGSSLRVSAFGYYPIEVKDWNGQPLDLSLQREPLQ